VHQCLDGILSDWLPCFIKYQINIVNKIFAHRL